MSILPPLNFAKFIEDNKDKLKPPVNNILLQKGEDYQVMAIGGPNKRTDYHINQTEEWFYQYKGDMLLKIVKDGKFVDIPIKEGEMFLLPALVPHSPVRFADTLGLVIEKNRGENDVDKLRWYCDSCKEIVHEVSFHCSDIVTQIKEAISEYSNNESARTCSYCEHINITKA